MTFGQFDKHCRDNSERIYIREQKNGRWGAFSLHELTDDVVCNYIQKWYKENKMPHMLKEGFSK